MRVLFAENDDVVAGELANMLGQISFNSNGHVKWARSLIGKEGLTVTDVEMHHNVLLLRATSNHDLHCVIEKLREVGIRMPILVLYDTTEEYPTTSMLTAGADGFAPLNLGWEVLWAHLSAAIRSHKYAWP
jgi:DNA-binding response OmpR family regulator